MLEAEAIVMQERIRGKSFTKIEKEHGFSNASRIFHRAISRPENVGFKRAEAIRLEEMRLDDLQDGIWGRALSGDPRAVEIALKVLERRARLLGLDFADMISGKLVEVEQAKVRVMAVALVQALSAIGANEEQKRLATTAFLAALRQAGEQDEEVTILEITPDQELL
jgi:hypothetical protein